MLFRSVSSNNQRSNDVSATSTPSRQSSLDSRQNSVVSPPVSDAGLPSGWSMQVAPNGRMFFIDHSKKATSWVDPRTGSASPMPNATTSRQSDESRQEDNLGPLPEGWEERVHSDGRVFFIDHKLL